MKKMTGLVIGMCLFIAWATAAAQDKSQAMNPPKVLTVTREFTKPGKNGMSHERTESAFVQAMAKAKWPTHYLAVDSLSGKPRSLFLTPYDSFEAWEKDTQATQKNAALSAALDHANVVDGEMLSGSDQGVLVFREDLSLHAAVDIPHMRYFEISRFQVKPGHDKDWEELSKMYQKGFDKNSNVHWATYQAVYGQPDGTYILFSPMKSASEVDKGYGYFKEFMDALGEDGMKKLSELSAAAVAESETNLFAFNPRMSYASDDWIKADDFWKPKTVMSTASASKPAGGKAAAKPAAATDKPAGQ